PGAVIQQKKSNSGRSGRRLVSMSGLLSSSGLALVERFTTIRGARQTFCDGSAGRLRSYFGTNSIVLSARDGSANPSTHTFDPLVGYFSPYAAVTASRILAPRTTFALTGISRSPA